MAVPVKAVRVALARGLQGVRSRDATPSTRSPVAGGRGRQGTVEDKAGQNSRGDRGADAKSLGRADPGATGFSSRAAGHREGRGAT